MPGDVSLTRVAENRLKGQYRHVVGVDEAGRGPLAGPVVAAACIVGSNVEIDGIIDSKQTTEVSREATYECIVNHPDILWEVSVVSHTEIDEVNILQATMNAMKRSVEGIFKKYKKSKLEPRHCIALIDGNRIPDGLPVGAQYVIKGDGSIFSIAAASIIAKVTRDRIMAQLHKAYPQYDLGKHKGYPTFGHRSIVYTFGPSDIHRLTFGPVKAALQRHQGLMHSSADCLRLAKENASASTNAPNAIVYSDGDESIRAKLPCKRRNVETRAAASERNRGAQSVSTARVTRARTLPKHYSGYKDSTNTSCIHRSRRHVSMKNRNTSSVRSGAAGGSGPPASARGLRRSARLQSKTDHELGLKSEP